MNEPPPTPRGVPDTVLTTAWLATALVALPWAYRIPWDTPRAVPLVLLAPPLWFGRRMITRRLAHLAQTHRRLALVAAVLGAAVLLSTIASAHWAASLTTASTWVVLGLAAVLVAELLEQSPRAAPWLLGAMVVSVALGTAAHWSGWKAGGSPQEAFYVHPRLMGLHALGGAIAAIAMLLHTWARPGTRGVAWLTLGVVVWGGLLWSGSRSPLIGIAAGVFVWLLKLGWRERVRLVVAGGALCVGGILLSALFWIDAPALGWWRLFRRAPAATLADQVTSNRTSFWADSLAHVRASPALGHGPDAYGFLTPQLEGAQPHNLVLQLSLDVGIIGAVAALVLVAACLWHGWRTAAAGAVPWLALAVGSALAAQVDGYFYYPLAAVASWLALGGCAARRATETAPPAGGTKPAGITRAWPAAAWGAAAILFFNCALFHAAVHGPPPARPDALVAQAWRAFPSVTFNVDDWIESWAREYPDDALAASRLARRHSQSPELFRVHTARLLAGRGDILDAVTELELALYEARPAQRPAIAQLLQRMRAQAGERR